MARETSQITINRLDYVSQLCYDKTIESDSWFDTWQMNQYWLTGHVTDCLASLRWAVEATNLGIRYLLDYNFFFTPKYVVPYWMSEFGGGEITYQAIVEAWAADDFAGRSVTIAFIDRMRQLIWDEPFNAVWAAKPEGG